MSVRVQRRRRVVFGGRVKGCGEGIWFVICEGSGPEWMWFKASVS